MTVRGESERQVIDNGFALHVAVEGRTLCGKPAAEQDQYDTVEAGWRVWSARRDRRCGRCAARNRSRARERVGALMGLTS